MNYAGYEKLRADIAALNNAMCDLRMTIRLLETRYCYDADLLTDRLVSQCLKNISNQFEMAYREALVLEQNFWD